MTHPTLFPISQQRIDPPVAEVVAIDGEPPEADLAQAIELVASAIDKLEGHQNMGHRYWLQSVVRRLGDCRADAVAILARLERAA